MQLYCGMTVIVAMSVSLSIALVLVHDVGIK